MEIIFSQRAAKEFRKLPANIRKRLKQKLFFYSLQPNPLSFAKPMTNSSFGGYRFRVGDYRILFDYSKSRIMVLKVGHRREIYS